MRRGSNAAAIALLALAAFPGAARSAQTSAVADATRSDCERLLSYQDNDVAIVSAETIVPSSAADANASDRSSPVRQFCRIDGRVNGNIGFELWLPEPSQWTGRFLGAGVGGSGGRYNLSDLARGVDQGFAAITTDSGHKASEEFWMLDRKKAQDYAHRAEHLVAVAGKDIVALYYKNPVRYAYFIGCSGGGRKALVEMQRYPDDYDGIIAGAPGANLPVSSARHSWVQQLEQRNPQTVLLDDDWQQVSTAVLDQCDALDGIVDGVLENPRQCRFDIASLTCRASSDPSHCLPAAKVKLMKQIVAPLTDENGKQLDPGLLPGVRTRPGGSTALTREMIGQLVYGDPHWQPDQFLMSRDTPAIGRVLPELLAEQTDLDKFARRGGKIILYQGWLDPSVRAQQTIGYFEAAEKVHGGRRNVQSFARLFMVPGMGHCRGGPGPDTFGGASQRPVLTNATNDMLSAMIAWVESGEAPKSITASKVVEGQVMQSRPLCPYPQQARYGGIGSTDVASSFSCR